MWLVPLVAWCSEMWLLVAGWEAPRHCGQGSFFNDRSTFIVSLPISQQLMIAWIFFFFDCVIYAYVFCLFFLFTCRSNIDDLNRQVADVSYSCGCGYIKL